MSKPPSVPLSHAAASASGGGRMAIRTPGAPAKSAITSQAMCANGLVFTAGVIPLDPETHALTSGDITTQTHQVMRNLRAVLEAAGSSLDQLVSVTVYLRTWADFDAMNQVYVSYLNPPLPARACVEVSHIGDDASLEIVAVALRESGEEN